MGLLDLMPTILELVDVKIPHSISGRSLVSDVLPEGDPKSNAVYFGEVNQLEMARVDDLKIIRNRNQLGSEEFYDLRRDPLEKDNLAGAPGSSFDQLLKLLNEISEANRTLRADIEQEFVTEDDEAMEALRALGYID